MIDRLLLATVMADIAVLIHGAGIAILGKMMRHAFVILYIVLGRFTLHGIKIGLYRWRVVGAIEGVNGILSLCWSTTFVLTVMNRTGLSQQEAARRLAVDGPNSLPPARSGRSSPK